MGPDAALFPCLTLTSLLGVHNNKCLALMFTQYHLGQVCGRTFSADRVHKHQATTAPFSATVSKMLKLHLSSRNSSATLLLLFDLVMVFTNMPTARRRRCYEEKEEVDGEGGEEIEEKAEEALTAARQCIPMLLLQLHDDNYDT